MKTLVCCFFAVLLLLITSVSHAQSLAARFDLAQDVEFQKAVRVAMIETAIAIIGEPTKGKIAVDDKRHTLAFDVLVNTEQWVPKFALAVAADPAASVGNDTSIRNRMDGIWNKFAGVRGNEPNNPAPETPAPGAPGPP